MEIKPQGPGRGDGGVRGTAMWGAVGITQAEISQKEQQCIPCHPPVPLNEGLAGI